jgi:hypothetical protein
MADRRLSALRGTNSDIADLTVRRQVPKENEVAQASLQRLLMQGGLEDARVEARGRLGIRHDDVEVLEAQILEGERRRCLCNGSCREQNAACCRQDPANKETTGLSH